MSTFKDAISRALDWMAGVGPTPPPSPAALPGAPPPPPRPVIRNQVTPPYEAAGQGWRATAWRAPDLAPNEAVLASVETLRARARAAVRNDGVAHAAVDRLVANLVGTGIMPQSQAPDPAFRARVHQLFTRWSDEADANGTTDFWGLQAQVCREWLTGGECFVRLRARLPSDGLTVPLQLQLLEAEQLPTWRNGRSPSGNRIDAGVERDALGRVVAYWFYRQRPTDLSERGSGDLTRVPAVAMNDPNVCHVFEPDRPGQVRGVPSLTRALIPLYEIDQYNDATIVRQKIATLFAGFIERQETSQDAAVDPMSGQPVETDTAGRPLMGLEPGLLQELPPGDKVSFPQVPDSGGYGEFMRSALMNAAIAADVPYEILTGDLRSLNDRTARVLLQEFRRRVEQRQYHCLIPQFMRPAWQTWIHSAIYSGALTPPDAYWSDPKPWEAVEWVAPAWPYLSPTQDAEAERQMVRSGFKSRTQVAKERGYDIETLEAEIAADNRRADAAGLTFDSDSRVAAPGSGASPAPGRPVQVVRKVVERDPGTGRITAVVEYHSTGRTILTPEPGGGLVRRETTRDPHGRITDLDGNGDLR